MFPDSRRRTFKWQIIDLKKVSLETGWSQELAMWTRGNIGTGSGDSSGKGGYTSRSISTNPSWRFFAMTSCLMPPGSSSCYTCRCWPLLWPRRSPRTRTRGFWCNLISMFTQGKAPRIMASLTQIYWLRLFTSRGPHEAGHDDWFSLVSPRT